MLIYNTMKSLILIFISGLLLGCNEKALTSKPVLKEIYNDLVRRLSTNDLLKH